MMTVLLTSLSACTMLDVKSGDYCDIYTVVDLPPDQAVLLERKYQERILANEVYEFMKCK